MFFSDRIANLFSIVPRKRFLSFKIVTVFIGYFHLKSEPECLQENKFPDLMKKAEINPVFKKRANTSKDNYRPITTLSNMKNKLSKYLTVLLKVIIRSIPFSLTMILFWLNLKLRDLATIQLSFSVAFPLTNTSTVK